MTLHGVSLAGTENGIDMAMPGAAGTKNGIGVTMLGTAWAKNDICVTMPRTMLQMYRGVAFGVVSTEAMPPAAPSAWLQSNRGM